MGQKRFLQKLAISIHALLAESDVRCFSPAGCWRISIHALLAESDEPQNEIIAYDNDFYPRSPCGERLLGRVEVGSRMSNFYPRSPCGERRNANCSCHSARPISIHALLAESDCYSLRHSAQSWHFYPRSPCGERRKPKDLKSRRMVFLSTLSLRRATVRPIEVPQYHILISIHALLAESDWPGLLARPFFIISIHALLAESDEPATRRHNKDNVFLSTLSLRRATLAGPSGPAFLYNFYPRSPCGERPAKSTPEEA